MLVFLCLPYFTYHNVFEVHSYWSMCQFPSFAGLHSVPLHEYAVFCLFIHPSVDIWIVSTFGLLQKCCYEHEYINASLSPSFQFFCVYTQKWHCWILQQFPVWLLTGLPYCPPYELPGFTLPLVVLEVSSCSAFLINTRVLFFFSFFFFYNSHPNEFCTMLFKLNISQRIFQETFFFKDCIKVFVMSGP